jgi:hypothetical protein
VPTLASPPSQDSLVELDETRRDRREPWYISRPWLLWLQDVIVPRVQTAPELRTAVVLTAQNASIGATPIPLASVNAGRYRISFYARVTTVDAVSSSLTITLGWSESGVALTQSGAAMTGNAITTTQSGSIVVQSDANAPLTYSTLYASNTPGAMQYRLSIVCESLG